MLISKLDFPTNSMLSFNLISLKPKLPLLLSVELVPPLLPPLLPPLAAPPPFPPPPLGVPVLLLLLLLLLLLEPLQPVSVCGLGFPPVYHCFLPYAELGLTVDAPVLESFLEAFLLIVVSCLSILL